jgi:hypothetical protein
MLQVRLRFLMHKRKPGAFFSFLASVDVLTIANHLHYNPDIAVKTIAIVKKLLNEGKLTPARIDESDAHIVQFKERLGKFQ